MELNMLFSENGANDMVYVGQAVNLYEDLGGDKSLIYDYYKKSGLIENNKEENIKNEINKIILNKEEMIELNEMPIENNDNEENNNNYYDDDEEDNNDNNDDESDY